ncbi:MAG: 3-oxoacyl-ACP synthase [Candidatus Promineifilaceae bacterium]|nr:3-oxoacyl-ACP synthase [Chloroflexota bacterium]MBP7591351.1 3-oxoacyl-ACP synthase [Chloroflexota bacterium]
MNQPPTVGIASIGTYSPEGILTAADIADLSGYPEWVIRDKFGITQKHVAGPDDQPNEMGIKAALDCLSQTNIQPEEIDVVLCTTEEWREYTLWTSGIHLAYEIGATNAWAMDVHTRCATTVGAMKMAKDMMIADPEINTVLIAGGYRVSDFINFQNPRTTFLWNIGSGGGAMLLRKNHPRNHVLGSHLIADGYMSKHVIVPASGTARFPNPQAMAAPQGVTETDFYFDLVEPDLMKERLNAVSMDNWVKCVDEALRKSGPRPDGAPYSKADLDFLNMVLIKPSGHKEMLDRLGLTDEQSVYLHDIGHTGEQDAMFGIREGLTHGRLQDGDLMAIVAAGIGYVWAAGIVKWGE